MQAMLTSHVHTADNPQTPAKCGPGNSQLGKSSAPGGRCGAMLHAGCPTDACRALAPSTASLEGAAHLVARVAPCCVLAATSTALASCQAPGCTHTRASMMPSAACGPSAWGPCLLLCSAWLVASAAACCLPVEHMSSSAGQSSCWGLQPGRCSRTSTACWPWRTGSDNLSLWPGLQGTETANCVRGVKSLHQCVEQLAEGGKKMQH